MTHYINTSLKFSKIILVTFFAFSFINLNPILFIETVEANPDPDALWGYHLYIDNFANDTLTMSTVGDSPWIDSESSTCYLYADDSGELYAWNFTFTELPFTDEEWSNYAKGDIQSCNIKVYADGTGSLKIELFNSNGESYHETWDLATFPFENVPPYRYYHSTSYFSLFDTPAELEDAHIQITCDADMDIKIWYVVLDVELDAYLPLPNRSVHNNTENNYVPILYDPNFDVNDYHEIRPKGQYAKPSPIFPEENETHTSGQWYAGLGHKPSPTSFAYTNNGFGYLYTDNDDNNPFIWSSSGFAQGMCVYGGGEQFGRFKVTNGSNTEESLGLYIDTSEPFDEELWLYTRAKIEDRGPLKIDVRSCASLGLFAGFQYVFEDGGELYYSNYMAPDETAPYPYLQALHCDLMIDRRWWDLTFQMETMQKGDTYRFSGGYFDDDRHLQLVMTEPMDELGVWYSFKINFTWVLETIRQMILEDFEKLRGEWGSGQIWYNFYEITKKWYNPDCYLKGLILREFYWFQEVNEAYQKSVTDYVFLSSEQNFTVTEITSDAKGAYQDKFTGQVAVWSDDLLVGTTPTSIIRVTNSTHKLYVPNEITRWKDDYDYYWDFAYWVGTKETEGDAGNYTCNPMYIYTEYDVTWTATYQFKKREFDPHIAFMGGKNLLCRLAILSPKEPPDYGLMATFENYGDKYLSAKVRKTLGNVNGTIAFDVFTSHQEILLDVTNIEKVDVQLGLLWDDCGRGDYLDPDSFNVDDITLKVTHDNVSRLDIYFRKVPEVLSVKYYGLEFDQWEYTDNHDLHLWLFSYQNSEIEIDFETAYSQSLNIVWALVGFVITLALLGFIRAKMG